MFGERNRRSLAFRGGGLSATGSGRGSGGDSWEAQAQSERQLNGKEPEQDDHRDLGDRNPASPGREEGGGSVSDSVEPEAEEEEDPEGGKWTAGGDADSSRRWTLGDKDGRWSVGNGLNGAAGAAGSEEERAEIQSWVEMRPQTLLHKPALFHSSWLQEFPWLKFCQETGLMSCSWCHNITGNHSDELVKGSRNYKRALLLRHHLSAEHGRNDPSRQETERPEDSEGTGVEDYRIKPNENSYCYQLLQELDKQRKKGILCDVNIVVCGQVFRAHKNILVAGSRYFKTLYLLTKNESPDQTTVTHLDVAAVQGFSVILDFLYSGNLLLTSQNAIEVMSVASYLQMSEVVQSCRAFIKDALNISIKQEAPDTVVVDYNKRCAVAKDEKKPSNFWATSILSKLSIKASGHVKEEPVDAAVPAWGGESSVESGETEVQGPGPVFVWNELPSGAGATIKTEDPPGPEPGSGRRKKQIARRFVYNVPPEPEEGFDEGMFIQPSASYTREDYFYISENPGETSDTALNKLKCPHCNYIAKHRRTLKRHLIIHSGVRSFSCDICGKLFTRREHVKRHSLVHKKDKKYKCMVCKKIFMLAASVGIRHGSRRYGVCVDCADSHQAAQEGFEAMQELEFSRDEDFEENIEADEDMGEERDAEEPTDHDQSNYEGDTGAIPED